MTNYKPGSIKQDPVSLSLGVCTALSGLDPDGEHNWMCMTTEFGMSYATDEDISHWVDLYALF